MDAPPRRLHVRQPWTWAVLLCWSVAIASLSFAVLAPFKSRYPLAHLGTTRDGGFAWTLAYDHHSFFDSGFIVSRNTSIPSTAPWSKGSFPNRVSLFWWGEDPHNRWNQYSGAPPLPVPANVIQPTFRNYSYGVNIPFWLLAMAVGCLGVWLFRKIRSAHPQAGLCPTCSYDLRASKDRCPECGSPIPSSVPNQKK